MASLTASTKAALTLLLSPPFERPHALALQEIFTLDPWVEFLRKFGFEVAASAVRPSGRGGTAIFYCSLTVTFTPIVSPECGRADVACCSLLPTTRSLPAITLASIYFTPSPPPPGSPPDPTIATIVNTLEDLGIDLITGDANARHPLWDGCGKIIPEPAKSRGENLASTLQYSQWNLATGSGFPTRPTSSTTPDVTIHLPPWEVSCMPHPVTQVHKQAMALASDHIPCLLTIHGPLHPPRPTASRCPLIAWHRIDWTTSIQQLNRLLAPALRFPRHVFATPSMRRPSVSL